LVIKENSRLYSNWQAKSNFSVFLQENHLLTVKGVDTRTLAVHLRQKGEMLGIISTNTFEPKELMAKIEAWRKKPASSLLPKISVSHPVELGQKKTSGKRIAVLDLGITQGILRQLERLGLTVTLLSYKTSAQEILKLKPRGLIISNGPEEDLGLEEVVANIRSLIKRLPILGISTGHQVLARALGAQVVKMKLGHRGVNYPIHNPSSYKGEITFQNHGYAVEVNSLNKIKGIKITRLASGSHSNTAVEGDNGEWGYYWLVRQRQDRSQDRKTDAWAVDHGNISITPLFASLPTKKLSALLKGLCSGLLEELTASTV